MMPRLGRNKQGQKKSKRKKKKGGVEKKNLENMKDMTVA